MKTAADLAKGLATSDLCGSDPIVDGEEWSCSNAEADGDDLTLDLEDEDGRTYTAVSAPAPLRVVE